MTIKQASRPPLTSDESTPVQRSWLRSLMLCLLLVIAVASYGFLMTVAQGPDTNNTLFIQVWICCFIPYGIACAWILCTRPIKGRWQWLELAIILVGALLFRAMLVVLPPQLSHDSWRYVWDARVTLHGYSPYVYPPTDKAFIPLRDFIYANSRYRTVPTLYPPAAEGIYILSYLLAPSNLFALKGIFILFDMGTCVALTLFLMKKGLDPRRVIIYAWSPLPIVEFAVEGHVDVITLTFTIFALLCAMNPRRGFRILTGLLIGLATLTKIYPIILLVVVARRRDYALIATCLATIIAGYIPFLILGHGQVFGFFSSYATEEGGNAGVVQLVTYLTGTNAQLQFATIVTLQHIVDVLVAGLVSLIVFILRQRERISMESATIILIGTIFAISSHVFPWYTTALLPWIAILISPLWTQSGLQLQGKGIAIAMIWYFVSVTVFGYFFRNTADWHLYYWFIYDVVIAGLALASLTGIIRKQRTKRTKVQQKTVL